MKKQVCFSVATIIIDGESPFKIESFDKIQNNTESVCYQNKENDESVVTEVRKLVKTVINSRFITFRFIEGERFPYSKTVVDTKGVDLGSLKECKNPRSPDEIEYDEELYFLIDIFTQRIYMSNLKKKTWIKSWLSQKLDNREVYIKSIVEEKDFTEKLAEVERINFSVEPNLFNTSKEDILSSHLTGDMYGFDADKAYVTLLYNKKKITDKIKDKINLLLNRKLEFSNIVVVGYDDEKLESTFNLEEITSKMNIEVEFDKESNLLDPVNVFPVLIEKILKQ